MTRPHRDQEPGVHHLTARGNARGAIFIDDEDRGLYLVRLEWTAHDFRWDVLLWCLMTNHVHLLVRTNEPNLAAGMQQLQGRYAQLFNERHRRSGHLFGGRYWSARLESEEHFEACAAYILHNPLAAGLGADWPWLDGTMLDVREALVA